MGLLKDTKVAKGYIQDKGLDYLETFSPLTKMVAIRCLLSLDIVHDWCFIQLYVNNTFLYEKLIEKVYMALPPKFGSKGESRVCKIKKLYMA